MAVTATIVEFLLAQQRNSSTALVGGTITFYAAGTTSFKSIWEDSLKTVPAANPYILNSRAVAHVYGDGNYDIVLKDSSGVVVDTLEDVYVGSDLSSIDLSSVIAAASFTNRDYIGNSQFNIWNFGTTFTRTTVVDTPTADGWYLSSDGSGAGTIAVTRENFTFGQSEVAGNPSYFSKINCTGATTGATYTHYAFRLPIATASGQQMTLRYNAKCGAPLDVSVVCKQYFGTGGSASVVTSTSAQTLTTNWVSYNKTFTIPSVSGKTTGAGAYVEIGISLPVNTTFVVNVASFKWELGTVAGVNEYRTVYEDDFRTSGKVSTNDFFLYADLDGGVNEKYWRMGMDYSLNEFTFSALDDSQSNPVDVFTATRSGTTVSSVKLNGVTPLLATDDTSSIATSSFVQDAIDARGYATTLSPTFTGTPVAPTASFGTNTTQIATTAYAKLYGDDARAYAASLAFSTALPLQTGNAGKFVTTNGTTASWADAKISNIVTATTATTLTSTGTLLKITPASYGVTVTLPDATTCSVGGPLHIIDNRGAYPVKVLNSAGVLKGFILAGVVSHVSLEDNSTAAGVWAIENSELVSASAQLLTTNMATILQCVDLGSGKEMLIGYGGASSYGYAVVYDSTTNTFGSPTLFRSVNLTANTNSGTSIAACLAAPDTVLVCSNAYSTPDTAFSAVVLTVSGTTITVGTAAPATLSANFDGFSGGGFGNGLVPVGTSFVASYAVVTPACQIRAITLATPVTNAPTIGAATVLDGTAGGLIAASGDKVIAVSTATTHLYTKPYTVSGSTITPGTGTDTTTGTGTKTLNKFAPLGTRWFVYWHDATANKYYGSVISLSGATTTISEVDTGLSVNGATGVDAIVISSSKVLLLSNASTNNANILTDTAGTASAGTPITLSSQATRACVYVDGTDVIVQDGTITYLAHIINCSGASPVKAKTFQRKLSNTEMDVFPVSTPQMFSGVSQNGGNAYLSGPAFAQTVSTVATTVNSYARIKNGEFSRISVESMHIPGTYFARGKVTSELWVTDAATVITKVECAL